MAAYHARVTHSPHADQIAAMVPHKILLFEGTYAVWLEGPDRYLEEVVGESFCQAHLERVTMGKILREYAIPVGAWLKAEVDNPHDASAVMVWVHGAKVGHLPRARAALWHPVVLSFQRTYRVYAACHAIIRGGWILDQPSDGQERAFYGVKLYLPVRL